MQDCKMTDRIAVVENDGPRKWRTDADWNLTDWKMQDWKLTDRVKTSQMTLWWVVTELNAAQIVGFSQFVSWRERYGSCAVNIVCHRLNLTIH